MGNNRLLYDGKSINGDNTPASLKMENNGSVLFSFPRATFLLTHLKNPLTAIIEVIVVCTSFPNIFFLSPLFPLFSDIQLNISQILAANFKFSRLGIVTFCSSLTPVSRPCLSLFPNDHSVFTVVAGRPGASLASHVDIIKVSQINPPCVVLSLVDKTRSSRPTLSGYDLRFT